MLIAPKTGSVTRSQAELEVNIWIFSGGKPVVVPVTQPTCSGEGRQDNIFKFTIPSDFSKLGSKIPGFKGCNPDTSPPCTLQIYAHSVETRTYSIGSPIIVTGHDASMTTSSSAGVSPMTQDPGMGQGPGIRDPPMVWPPPAGTVSGEICSFPIMLATCFGERVVRFLHFLGFSFKQLLAGSRHRRRV